MVRWPLIKPYIDFLCVQTQNAVFSEQGLDGGRVVICPRVSKQVFYKLPTLWIWFRRFQAKMDLGDELGRDTDRGRLVKSADHTQARCLCGTFHAVAAESRRVDIAHASLRKRQPPALLLPIFFPVLL
jgi:hypothetical protein